MAVGSAVGSAVDAYHAAGLARPSASRISKPRPWMVISEVSSTKITPLTERSSTGADAFVVPVNVPSNTPLVSVPSYLHRQSEPKHIIDHRPRPSPTCMGHLPHAWAITHMRGVSVSHTGAGGVGCKEADMGFPTIQQCEMATAANIH